MDILVDDEERGDEEFVLFFMYLLIPFVHLSLFLFSRSRWSLIYPFFSP